MALADFLDKAALAASHVLNGFDPSVFTGVLEAQVVGVFFDEAAAVSPEGTVTLELIVNLLARLYPSLALIPLGEGNLGSAGQSERLAALVEVARAINPVIDLIDDVRAVTVGVVVGATAPQADCAAPLLFAGSDGWVAAVSPERPVGSGDSANPFGAAAAACFAAANVFRVVFGGQLARGERDQAWRLSLLDLVPRFEADGVGPAAAAATAVVNPRWAAVELGEAFLAGVGAVGSSAVWTLSRAAAAGGLSGTLHLIDPEAYDATNLQRYVLAEKADVGVPKAVRAAAAFPEGGGTLTALAHVQRWGEFLAARDSAASGGAWRLDHVAVALDSGEDRCALQASLPRRIVNAWTQTGDLGVSRHDFLGDQACLMCLYLPEGRRKGRHELIAESVGMPEAAADMAQLLHSGEPLGPARIARLAQASGVPVERLMPFQHEPLEAFYAKAVCGGVVLAAGGGSRSTPGRAAEVPLAFQSALAGVLLAAEMVAHAGGLRPEPLPTTTKIDLLRPLGRHLSLPEPKHRSGLCVCQDPDYIAAYERKYADGSAATAPAGAPP